MTLTSILRPTWVSYHLPLPPQRSRSSSVIISRSLGLHQSCISTSSGQTTCRPFPTRSDCDGEAAFCAMWRTVGWLMSLASVLEMAALVGVAAVLVGGRARREGKRGWGVVVGLMGCVGAVLFGGLGIVVSYCVYCLPPRWKGERDGWAEEERGRENKANYVA